MNNLKLKDVQNKVNDQIINYGGYWQPLSIMLRLLEEMGELARAVNIKYGEKLSKSSDDGRAIPLELVDVFYTSISLANLYNVDLGDEEINNIQLSYNKKQKDNLNYLTLPLELNKKVGILSGLMSKAYINNVYMDRNKVKLLIQNIINKTIQISSSFQIDLTFEFNKKVNDDEIKINRVY